MWWGRAEEAGGGQSEIYVCEKMIYIYYVACKLVSLFSLSSFLSSAAAGFGKTPRSRGNVCARLRVSEWCTSLRFHRIPSSSYTYTHTLERRYVCGKRPSGRHHNERSILQPSSSINISHAVVCVCALVWYVAHLEPPLQIVFFSMKSSSPKTHRHTNTAPLLPKKKGTRRKRKIWRASTGSCCLCVRACARARDILRLALPTSISRRDDDGVHGWLTLREAAVAAQRVGKKLH